MSQFEIHSRSGSYRVFVGGEERWALAKRCLDAGIDLVGRELVFISDQNTEKFAREIADRIGAVAKINFLSVPTGEGSKSIEQAQRLFGGLAECSLTRNGVIVAVGGGVVGDLAGFVAASWMRGVDLVQVPSTLMAQVDSSLGGKVGVNLPQGKNLVGAFYPPKLVITDPELLSSLPERNFRDGFAEVIKYGVLFGDGILELCDSWLSQRDTALLQRIIERCVAIKARVVSEDEFERKDERVALNFGHTVGHGLEAAAAFGSVSHGEAVALGMIVEASIGVDLGVSETTIPQEIRGVVEKFAFKLPVELLKSSCDFISADKKRCASRIKMAFPDKVGNFSVREVEVADVTRHIRSFRF